MYVHSLLRTICASGTLGSRRRRRTLHHQGLRKLELNSGTTRRSAKNAHPSIAAKPSLKARVSLKTGRSTNSGDELNLRHLPRDPRRRPAQQGHRPPIRALRLRDLYSFLLCPTTYTCRCTATGMSTTLSKNCANCALSGPSPELAQ